MVMENKIEKNIHGEDCVIEMYYSDGKLDARWEWNASRTKACLVEEFYRDGSVYGRCEWNHDRTETCVIESYHGNGQRRQTYEWNHDRTETFLVELFDESGRLIEKRIWNEARTFTMIEQIDDNIIFSLSDTLAFAEWIEANCERRSDHEWLYRGDNFLKKYTTERMYKIYCYQRKTATD